jgi:hypothetical protein
VTCAVQRHNDPPDCEATRNNEEQRGNNGGLPRSRWQKAKPLRPALRPLRKNLRTPNAPTNTPTTDSQLSQSVTSVSPHSSHPTSLPTATCNHFTFHSHKQTNTTNTHSHTSDLSKATHQHNTQITKRTRRCSLSFVQKPKVTKATTWPVHVVPT